jgi:putative phosphoribosyl transferase
MYTYREQTLFKNRKDAGLQLAEILEKEFRDEKPIILGIPRGGVEIAFYVANQLDTDFTVVLSKKLGFPGHEELAFGAVAEDGTCYISAVGRNRLNPEIIDRIKEVEIAEIERRIRLYRNGERIPDLTGRTVILVDDGISTGATFVPLITMCKKANASQVIVAAPVSPSSNLDLLKEADAIRVLAQPYPFYAVGQFYESFQSLTDLDVLSFLD